MNRIKKIIAFQILATAFIVSCNQGNKAKEQNNTETQDSVAPVLKDKNKAEAYEHYIHLKDALVASDLKEAQIAGKELADELKKIEGCEITAGVATKIANASDLKEQRAKFTPLSSDIIAMMKNTEIVSGNLYVEYCPMANDGKGGYWLSSNSEIENPYYGDEMLNCGEVKEVLKKK